MTVPLGKLVAITGASGSGKSTLVNEILYKALWKKLEDTRTLPGEHDGVDGIEHVHKVVSIDQTPIGRNSRSNPATYVGFYDAIRDLFTNAPLAIERDYRPGRFSFNVKGGRCEECQGEGVITTQLYFMPDVEVTCSACKGARFNSETLEVTIRGKTIDDVLNMSVEEGVGVFRGRAGAGQEDRGPERSRPRLPDARPVGHDPLRRRGAAHQDRDRVVQAAALEAHHLYPRRADDRAAPGRRRAPARVTESAGGCRTHGDPHRTPHGRHQDRRSCHRSGAGWRARRRSRRRRGHARAGGPLQGVAHRAVSQAAPEAMTYSVKPNLTWGSGTPARLPRGRRASPPRFMDELMSSGVALLRLVDNFGRDPGLADVVQDRHDRNDDDGLI